MVQVVQSSYYHKLLDQNHSLSKTTAAKRGNIYVDDVSKSQALKLTENVTLYDIFVDPSLIYNKPRVIQILSPLLYVHLCQTKWFDSVDKEQCIKNVEQFTKQSILPKAPRIMYYGSEVSHVVEDETHTRTDDTIMNFDRTGYNQNYQDIINNTTKAEIEERISTRLDEMIVPWDDRYNYLWYYSNVSLINELRNLDRDYIYIYNWRYVFIEPKVFKRTGISKSRASKEVEAILTKRGYLSDSLKVKGLFDVKTHRYVRLVSGVSPGIIDALNQLKRFYYSERWGPLNTPLLHGVWTDAYTKRYYPYGSFLSHVLWYISNDGQATYGIEEYFDSLLKWTDGSIQGTTSSMIGQLGANDITIENAKDGYDIYLTIDPVIQTQAEKLVQNWRERYNADSASILVYDPYSGKVLASANAPNFDPNHYNDYYTLEPLTPEDARYVDDITYLDIPIYTRTWGNIKLTTLAERQDSTLPKYRAKEPLWPNLFVDKNIAYPGEPGSIFKAFTYAIGLDQGEIDMYDWYEDPESKVKVGPYTIRNASVEECRGTHTFLYALQYSCNVGMVRIAQKTTQETFYNYLNKLNFGSLTNIELAGENAWFVEWVGSVSLARFFNNAFGQGLLTTPIQIVAAYGALINGWSYLKPTIIEKICEFWTKNCQENKTKIIRQVFDPRVSEKVKASLTEVLHIPSNARHAALPPYNLGGKTGTSQLSFRWRYQWGNWRTNGSLVGMVTEDNVQYIVMIELRRPRTTQRWINTAGPMFKEMAEFLINYSSLQWEKFLTSPLEHTE